MTKEESVEYSILYNRFVRSLMRAEYRRRFAKLKASFLINTASITKREGDIEAEREGGRERGRQGERERVSVFTATTIP